VTGQGLGAGHLKEWFGTQASKSFGCYSAQVTGQGLGAGHLK